MRKSCGCGVSRGKIDRLVACLVLVLVCVPMHNSREGCISCSRIPYKRQAAFVFIFYTFSSLGLICV